MQSGKKQIWAFTLLELVIVLAVMTILAGVLIPVVKQVLDSAKVSKIVSVIDTLTSASRKYYKDTRKFATEDSGESGVLSHTLAYDPRDADASIQGWSGPYIEGPLMVGLLPFEPTPDLKIRLVPGVGGVDGSEGYYLTGEGGPNTYHAPGTNGQEIIIEGLTGDWPKKINDLIDKGVPGEQNEWTRWGRVTAANGSPGTLYIFVLDPFGKTN